MRLTQDNIESEFMRAGALQQAGRLEEAVALWREIAAAAPQSPEARANLGGTLLELGQFDAGEIELRRAVEMKPQAHWAHYNLGRLHQLTRRWAQAEDAFQAALALAPSDAKVRLALGQLYLAQGDYARGWPLYEARSEVPSQNAPRLTLPGEWAGEPIAGRKLLIWPEQGFGDQIQFARFAPVLKAMGADVTLAAPPELTVLFASLGVRIAEQTPDKMTVETPDVWTLLLSIPGRLGATLETLPQPPYLAVPPARRARWAGHAAKGAVGVVWRGRPTPGNTHRSLPSLEALRALAEAGARLVDLSEPLGDFADLAAVIEQLDLLVTIDTAAAHLAGALGKPCWVLLPWFRTDWRWLAGREDSPWYPSLRLFRQPAFGDWDGAIAALARAYAAQFRS
ncbi:tetratricopeptide repeat protein [Phenylobacterium sp.]|uniref:tetratricopeptide repeat protein n=1 Tax=Phenylobacterium sp. TaxID=1871053 RepID=UPI002DF3DF94|nr:tetratricopeptide repeat protein [Phenylobacterium sp.]